MLHKEINADYIRGFIEGTGSLTFSTANRKERKVKIPTFMIKMHIDNHDLLTAIRDQLGLKNKVYSYHHAGGDKADRASYSLLTVREIGALKNVIIPLFYNNMLGSKSTQFIEWINKIGNDPMVPENYRLLYRLYKSGFYDR